MKKYWVLSIYFLYLLFLAFHKVNPVNFPFAAFISLSIIPFSIAVVIIAILCFLFNQTRLVKGVSVAMVLLSFTCIFKIVNLNFKDEEISELTIVSFNASFFRVPPVFSDTYFNPTRPNNNDSSINWLIDQYPDFLLIQEFFDDEGSEHFNNLQNIMIRGRYRDYYFLRDPRHDNGVSRGLIIFSRWPILEKNKIFLDENRFNGAQEAIVEWGDKKIRLINLHLKSSEFDFSKASAGIKGAKYEIQKLFLDAEIRSEQLNWVLNHPQKSYPTFIAGDFNSTRTSYVHDKISGVYQNSFEEGGTGFGFTYKEAFSIPVKIDHQFHSDEFSCDYIYVQDSLNYSEHLPLIGGYSLATED